MFPITVFKALDSQQGAGIYKHFARDVTVSGGHCGYAH